MSEVTDRAAGASDCRFDFKVSGMDCPSCAARVETALARLEGISDVRVNFFDQVVTFREASPQTVADAANVKAAIRKLGYGVEPLNGPTRGASTEAQFRVTGLDCPTCANKIATVLEGMPGVTEIGVNFGTQILSCKLDPANVQPDAVERTVKALGYHVELLSAEG